MDRKLSGNSSLPKAGQADDLYHSQLAAWNDTARDYPFEYGIHQLIERQVDRTPDAPAVLFNDQCLSYAELESRANSLANYLLEDILRDSPADGSPIVAVSLDRSLEMLVSLYAIHKAGAAYLPLDPYYPPERTKFILEEAAVAAVLTQRQYHAELESSSYTAICVDEFDPAYYSGERPLAEVGAGDLAYVIYTSGSTGQPKGVMNEHRALCNRLLWMQDSFSLSHCDKVVQKTPYTFDVSVWEFFWPLMAGAQLVLMPPNAHRDASAVAQFFIDYGITVAHFVPSMLQLFLRSGKVEECRQLRSVICSGEALPKNIHDRFFELSGAELYNLYGPTEAAIDVSMWHCKPDSPYSFVPIGKAIANTQLYILDEELIRIPPGDVGELYIGGVQVARGYLNRTELTVERFIPDCFSATPGGRLYKTGDLARFLGDGSIEFLGRNDFQVKLRGFRVELGEIEVLLHACDNIEQAIVLVRENPATAIQELLAYLTTSSDEQGIASRLRRELENTLPDYMIPERFIELDSLPLTANGKLDRQALLAEAAGENNQLARIRPNIDQAFVSAQTPLQGYLIDLWSEILGIEGIGVNDRYFELGGTSLQAGLIVERLQRELGESLFVVSIFDAPTVAEYASFLQREYAGAVIDRLGFNAEPEIETGARTNTLVAQDFENFRRCIPQHLNAPCEQVERNQRAIFILSPPRSGTSLLRLMLAGHPQLYAGSEFQLLHFETMADRAQAYAGKFSLWLEGLVRLIMDVKQCTVEQAKVIVEEFERNKISTREVFGQLQAWLGKATLVDKSPSYALDYSALEKAEGDFDEPFYIHLVRHPQAVTQSFVDMHMDQVMYLEDHPFNPRQLGELVWSVSHQNILRFLETVDKRRWIRVDYEFLVANPRQAMMELCAALAISYHDDLIDPYKNIGGKTVDGIYAQSRSMTDPHLLEESKINPELANMDRYLKADLSLSEITRALSVQLGYKLMENGDRLSQRRQAQRQRRRKNRRTDKGGESIE